MYDFSPDGARTQPGGKFAGPTSWPEAREKIRLEVEQILVSHARGAPWTSQCEKYIPESFQTSQPIYSYILNSVRFLAALCFRRSLTAQGLSIQPPDDPRPPRDPQNEPVDNSTQTSKYDEAGRWRSRRFFLDVGLGGGVFRTSVYLQRLITVYGTLLILSTPQKQGPEVAYGH